MKPRRPKPRKRIKKPDIRDVAAYLESVGWSVMVIGPGHVQQQPGAYKFNYELVIPFTGNKKVAKP